MQFIARDTAPPSILTGSVAKMQREHTARFMASNDEELAQKRALKTGINLNHESMRKALDRVFNGRCAFCEARTETLPYHFRPFEEAQPYESSEHAHLYYHWLDISWQNFYTICASCIPREPNYFPVFGKRAELPSIEQYRQYADENTALWPGYPLKEKPVLLDPCLDRDFHKHLGARNNGKLAGLTERGVETIKHFRLNAPQRVAERYDCYRRYYRQLLEWVESPIDESRIHPFNFSSLEFGGTWYLLVRRLAAAVGAKKSSRPVLSMGRIERTFAQLRYTRDAREHLQECWRQIAEENPEEFSNARTQVNRPSDATVTEIRIDNFKSIEHLSIGLPSQTPNNDNKAARRTPSILIIGENSAGKSSILEAIALGLSTAVAIKELGLTAKNFILDPRFLGATAPADLPRARVEIVLSNQSRRVLDIESARMHSPHEEQQENIPVFAYGAFRQYQHKGRRRSSPEAFVRNLFDGSVLPNPEQWLLDLKPDRFAMVIRALRHILSIDGEFEVIRRDPENRQCFVVTAMREDRTALSQSTLNVASSGFRSMLAMACDVMRGMMDSKIYPDFESLETARGVVLIDEVEAHLHPRWKMKIMRGLRLALPNATFIATTHDPLCLRGMNDGEIVVLRRVKVDNGTTAAGLPMQIEAKTDLPPISELGVEQLLTSDLFQLHSTDDPEMDHQFAEIADLLAKSADRLTDDEHQILDRFKRDVASALPIGTSEAHRLVQEAVAEYLQLRAQASTWRLAETRAAVKRRIVEALQGIL
jgi:hypothetical protein